MTTTDTPTDARAELETALRAARLAKPLHDLEPGRRLAILPGDCTTQIIDSPHALPPFIKEQPTLDDAESLIAYANRFSSAASVIIADIDHLRITAALDYHWDNLDEDGIFQPGARCHNATLKLRESEEFRRWSEMENTMHDQMAFAEFLDENASDIVDPAPSVMIEIARDLEATQGVMFKASTRLQTGERSLTYETETHTRGDMTVPTRFTLQIPLFSGESPIDIEASFRFRPRQDGLKLGFVWRRVEYRRQAEFREIATRVSDRTGLLVVFGRTS